MDGRIDTMVLLSSGLSPNPPLLSISVLAWSLLQGSGGSLGRVIQISIITHKKQGLHPPLLFLSRCPYLYIPQNRDIYWFPLFNRFCIILLSLCKLNVSSRVKSTIRVLSWFIWTPSFSNSSTSLLSYRQLSKATPIFWGRLPGSPCHPQSGLTQYVYLLRRVKFFAHSSILSTS